MPILHHEPLETLAHDIFQAIKVPPAGAAWMARLLVRANLRGHDSHGVIRIPQYIASWKKGDANPTAEPVVVQEGPATALVDGKLGFGQIVARRGMEVAMQKAAAVGVSTVGVFNSNHIGRLADYTEMALERDMLAILAVNAGGAGQRMAPWGGRAPRLSTNPIAFACPTGEGVTISFDIATTMAAEGKVRVKRNRKEPLPPGWVLDADGNPTTDPNAIYGSPPGTILPVGGHKGYSLALMIEVLAGILARGGYSRENPGPVMNGIFMVVVDIGRFVAPGTFRDEVDDLIRYLKSSPTVPGVDQILAPGEPEAITEAKRRQAGIFVEDQTWGQIEEVARELNVAIPSA
ncbi:MAG: Ldh family oxidoreductase [candidate division NC10 bacterium]|nr:Ldh family oxidoreductase [candidate division NC10 bacterium]MBI2116774.1 Ldh family oxidoreductase [candidate division NC10 bacterium]MBI2458041.1 Ldh family oxidoreductase [candidate division NC10 bacterium]MBI2562161.1 Ldh family oxidoreductase [candidate division NC10 bacterium]